MVTARIDDDSCDITESVGATALGAAMARAAESDCDCPLFTDRYARLSRICGSSKNAPTFGDG